MQLFHGSLTHINTRTTRPGERHSRRPGQRCALDFFLSAWMALHARGSSAVYTQDLDSLWEKTESLRGHAVAITEAGIFEREVRVEFGGVDFSQRQGLLQSFLYELQTLVTNFADGAERDL